MAVLLTFMGLLGLAIGSFLNVVIHRVPASLSLVSPPSHCPRCAAPIRNRHNVPVLGWLLLRGRCADCAAPISMRYPAVELLTCVLFVAVTARLEYLKELPALAAYLYLAAAGVALAFIDLDVRRLPNVIVLPSYPVIGVLLGLSAWWQGDPAALIRAVEAGAALYGFYFLLMVVYPAGMGFGDVKLAGVLGACLGYLSWSTLLVGAFGGFFLGAVAGVVVLAVRRGTRKSQIPFGPFMIAGALLAVLLGAELADAYASLLLHRG